MYVGLAQDVPTSSIVATITSNAPTSPASVLDKMDTSTDS